MSPTSHFVVTMNSNVWSTYKVAKSQTKIAMFETPEPWVTICKESLNHESYSLRRLSLESRVWNALTLLKKVGKPQDCTYYNCFDRLLVAILKCLQHLYLEFKYSELLKPEFKSLERQTHEFKLLEHLNPDSKCLECPHPDFKCVMQKTLIQMFATSKPRSRNQKFGTSKTWIQMFGKPTSWNQLSLNSTLTWFQIPGKPNP